MHDDQIYVKKNLLQRTNELVQTQQPPGLGPDPWSVVPTQVTDASA